MNALAKAIVNEAVKHLRVREVGGNNRGPDVEAFLKYTGHAPGQPWCAAWVSFVVTRAIEATGLRLIKPKTARAFAFEQWGLRNHLPVIAGVKLVAQDFIEPGDIIVFGFSHVGIALSSSSAGDAVHTIEGNTGPGAARRDSKGMKAADGVYEMHRARSLIRSIIHLPN